MKNAAAISAQLVDVRNVGQHKCVRLELHVPAEQAGMVLAAFGWPTQVDPVPVAIARLDPELVKEVVSPESPHIPVDTSPASGPDKVQARARKLPSPEKRLADRAGILCADPLFWKFLDKDWAGRAGPIAKEYAARAVRAICDVKSRSEIKPNTEAGRLFDNLYSRFVVWRDADIYVEASA